MLTKNVIMVAIKMKKTLLKKMKRVEMIKISQPQQTFMNSLIWVVKGH